MTPAEVELIVDMINVEDLLLLRGNPEELLLAAALGDYRRRLERKCGFVRLAPDCSDESLKQIEIRRGKGWLKLSDMRVNTQHGMK